MKKPRQKTQKPKGASTLLLMAGGYPTFPIYLEILFILFIAHYILLITLL